MKVFAYAMKPPFKTATEFGSSIFKIKSFKNNSLIQRELDLIAM